MKKTFLTILVTALFMHTAPVQAAVDAKKAETFVIQVTENGIEDIINANISKQEKQTLLKILWPRVFRVVAVFCVWSVLLTTC